MKLFLTRVYYVAAFLALLFMVAISSTGCSSQPIVKPLVVKCADKIPAEAFEACFKPSPLPAGTTFEQGLADNAKLTTELKKCAAKAELLQQAIKACDKVTGL